MHTQLFWRTHSNDLKYCPLSLILPLISSDKTQAPAPPHDSLGQLYTEIKVHFHFSKQKDPSSVSRHTPHAAVSQWLHTSLTLVYLYLSCTGEPTLDPVVSREEGSSPSVLLIHPRMPLTSLLQGNTDDSPSTCFSQGQPWGFFLPSCFPAVWPSTTWSEDGLPHPSTGLGTWICNTPINPLPHRCSAALGSSPAFHCAAIPQPGMT